MQVFRTAGCEGVPESPSNIPWALTKSCSKQNMKRNSTPKYGTDDLSEPPHRLPGVRSLLPLPGGDLLTGGTNRTIQYWDHNRFEPSSSTLCYSLKLTNLLTPFFAVLVAVFVFVGPQKRLSLLKMCMICNLGLVFKLCR